jgi:dTDP-4-dehydrorhamnose 3,5-epimerase
MEDDTLVQYYCSYPYTPEAERGLRYNDPLFNFNWPVDEPAHISDKDNNWPDFIQE